MCEVGPLLCSTRSELKGLGVMRVRMVIWGVRGGGGRGGMTSVIDKVRSVRVLQEKLNEIR